MDHERSACTRNRLRRKGHRIDVRAGVTRVREDVRRTPHTALGNSLAHDAETGDREARN